MDRPTEKDRPTDRADDGIRTRDPHLGKVIANPAGVRLNRSSPDHRLVAPAGDRSNRWRPLDWIGKRIGTRRVVANGFVLPGRDSCRSFPIQKEHWMAAW